MLWRGGEGGGGVHYGGRWVLRGLSNFSDQLADLCFSIAADEHTEELLERHEMEIVRLKELMKRKEPILGQVKKWFEICAEEKVGVI